MGVERSLVRFMVVVLIVASPSLPVQAEAPAADSDVADATLTLTARSAGVGVGFVWGGGSLEYRGQSYPVRIDGMGIGTAGMSSIRARGAVYHLNQVEDLNGQYSAFGAGVAVGQGANRVRMRNAKGVVIDFHAEGTGVQFGIGPRGVTLQVGEAGAPAAEAGFTLPKTLGFGEAAYGKLLLQPTLNLQFAGFAEGNAGFGGEWAAGPIKRSDLSMQHSSEVGMN
ncbi:MAG TPA: hypothetical protein VMT89_12315, partial [Candidatus Acidoferrales bacterium]|nr:hypothetical protein [Candidatus Acidoferrales bacterium]